MHNTAAPVFPIAARRHPSPSMGVRGESSSEVVATRVSVAAFQRQSLVVWSLRCRSSCNAQALGMIVSAAHFEVVVGGEAKEPCPVVEMAREKVLGCFQPVYDGQHSISYSRS